MSQVQEEVLATEPFKFYFEDVGPEITSLIVEGRGDMYINEAFSKTSGAGVKTVYIKCEKIILYIKESVEQLIFPKVESIKFECNKFIIFGGADYNTLTKSEENIKLIKEKLAVKFPNANVNLSF
jgi:hypothetical protein